jgi:hypothetical protein
MRHFRGLVEADAVFLGTVTVLVVYLTLVPIGVMVLGSFQKGLPGAWTPATLEITHVPFRSLRSIQRP